MLRFLRSGSRHTKTLWWAIAIVTVAGFIFGFVFLFGAGLSSSGRTRFAGGIGSVNGHTISPAEYQNALQDQRESYRRQFGVEPAERDARMIEMQAWRTLVTQRLLAEEARKLGLKAHDREVVLALETSPPASLMSSPVFQTDGKFDPSKYRAALHDPNNNWASFEQLVRAQLPVRKLQERLLASIKLSEPELRRAYRDRYEKIDCTVLVLTPSGSESVPAASEADLQRIYQTYRGRFSSGPSAQLELLVQPKQAGEEETRSARELAASLVTRGRSGEDFAALARDYSEAPGAENGGEIARVLTPADFGVELAPRIAGLQPGQVTDAIPQGGRFLIFKLIARVPNPPSPEPGLKMSQIVVRVRPNEGSLRAQKQALLKLRNHAASVGLGKAAAEKGLATTKSGFYDFNSQPPALMSVPEAGDWGLSAKVGAVSPVFEGLDDFVIAQVSAKTAGGPAPREEIESSLRQIAELDARVGASRPRADSIAAQLARGATLEQVAQGLGLTPMKITGTTRAAPDPRLSGAPEVAGAVFGAQPRQVVGPIRSLNGWYFARLDGVTPADPAAYDTLRTRISSGILQRRQQSFFAGYLGEIRMKAKIQDLRAAESY